MRRLTTVIVLLGCLLTACSHAPEPVRYGKDACAHCKMTIMDKRFAAELVTAKGKIFKFDAAECMAAYLEENPAVAADMKSNFLVSDFNQPGQFSDARKAWFLRDSSLSSPMGGNLAAFITQSAAKRAQHDPAAKVCDWMTLLKEGDK
jgi:copper chaperone NosL